MRQTRQGPAEGVLKAGRHLLTTLLGITTTRLQLLSLELGEEKARLLQLLLMLGLILMLTGLGLICLILLIFLMVDESSRLLALGVTAATLLLSALVLWQWLRQRVRRSRFLKETCHQFKEDRRWLEDQL